MYLRGPNSKGMKGYKERREREGEGEGKGREVKERGEGREEVEGNGFAGPVSNCFRREWCEMSHRCSSNCI